MKTLEDRIEELEDQILQTKMSANEFRKAISNLHALGVKLEADNPSKKKVVKGLHDVAYRFMN